MRIRNLHSWDLTAAEAAALQRELHSRLDVPPVTKTPKFIAGTDVSFNKHSKILYGGVVIYKYDDLTEIESRTAVKEISFPYVPGLLSFREAPVLLEAFRKVECVPDIILCDGQGTAHPRGFGLACHLGVILDLPSIGCAKSRLCGEHPPIGENKGEWVDLTYKEDIVGMVLRTRSSVKPVYVSVGYKVTSHYAREIVLHCCPRCRIPEPNRAAHRLVNSIRQKL